MFSSQIPSNSVVRQTKQTCFSNKQIFPQKVFSLPEIRYWCWPNLKKSRPKGNYRSPESNMPGSQIWSYPQSRQIAPNENSPLWPNFEHMWDFMPAQVNCKFHKEPIYWKDYALNNVIFGRFQQSKANNSKVTSPTRPEFEFFWDLMNVLVPCKLDKDPINNEHASVETSFSHYSLYSY